MSHYICTGECGGVSDTPGTCQDGTCGKHQQSLQECDCSDKKHGREEENTEDQAGNKPANWALSSVVECLVYTEKVGGSIPSAPTF